MFQQTYENSFFHYVCWNIKVSQNNSSHKCCENSCFYNVCTVPAKYVGTCYPNFFVPICLVGTAVPTNLSAQTTIYNSAAWPPRALARSCFTSWISSGRDSVREQLPAHHINKTRARRTTVALVRQI